MPMVYVCKVATDNDIDAFESGSHNYSKLREDYRYYYAPSAQEASMYFIQDIMGEITRINSEGFTKNVLVIPANFNFDNKPELFTVKLTCSVEKYKSNNNE